jgi:hypothetical protein
MFSFVAIVCILSLILTVVLSILITFTASDYHFVPISKNGWWSNYTFSAYDILKRVGNHVHFCT